MKKKNTMILLLSLCTFVPAVYAEQKIQTPTEFLTELEEQLIDRYIIDATKELGKRPSPGNPKMLIYEVKRQNLINKKVQPFIDRMLADHEQLVKENRRKIRKGIKEIVDRLNENLIAGIEPQKIYKKEDLSF